jgi:glycosyltransferase involved in cell wall biosynthesis
MHSTERQGSTPAHPKVSVVLTCFNHLSFLGDALESIQRQTFESFELIIIDDGSTDGTREFLQTVKCDRLILNDVNLGTYASLNKAISSSSGEYIAILNDDDFWEETKLSDQVELLEARPDVGLVGCDGFFIDASGKQTLENPLGFEFPVFETGTQIDGFVYRNLVIPSGALFRRSLFEELGGFDEAFFGSGDWDLWLRFAMVSSVGCVQKKLLRYRVHSGGASTNREKILNDDLRLRTRMLELIPESPQSPKQFAFIWAAMGATFEELGQKQHARQCFRSSLSYNPSRVKSWFRLLKTFLP